MVSDADDLLRSIAGLDPIPWSRPSDLNRISFQSLFDEQSTGRTIRSAGAIRVFGQAVANHQARIDSAGHILLNFQRLVSASGGFLRGVTSNRGALPAEITTLTQLHLAASARLGSVVFDLIPESLPSTELADPHGTALFDHRRRQFVDEAVDHALSIVRSAHELGPDADNSRFVELVTAGGPRLASAVREFATGVEAADFDVDLEWREPARATTRATFTTTDAKFVKTVIAARDLDSEPTSVAGRLITLSVARAWQLDVGDGHLVTVDVTHLEGVDLTEYHLDQAVVIQAIPRVRQFPGGAASTTFIATSIAPV